MPSSPVRFTSGFSNLPPWQLLGRMGMENPFFYHVFADDFDLPASLSGWVQTVTTGTAVNVAGDGGLLQMETAATVGDFVSIQRGVPSFVASAGSRMFFVARMTLGDVTASAFMAGMIPVTATPFTGSPQAGVWISKAAGGTQLMLNVSNAGVVTSTLFPTKAYTLQNGVSFDIGFSLDRDDSIRAMIAPNMVGYVPQSGTNQPNSTNRSPVVTSPVGRNVSGIGGVLCAPIVAVQASTAVAQTLTLDFVMASKER
jgi:hypothetical protein